MQSGAAKELDEDQYTAESYAVLKAAIKSSEAVAAKENATVEEKQQQSKHWMMPLHSL